jgi:Ala-tRNA(Pro) deacylase
MAIAMTFKQYLDQHGVPYEVVMHPRAYSSMRTAEAAHIPGHRLAKSVILEDDDGYVMAIVPSDRQIHLRSVSDQLQRDLRLATEQEISALFKDCDVGAIPPVGRAYGLKTLVDDSLTREPDVYLEAGDHEELIHVSHDAFLDLLGPVQQGHFS